VYIEINLLPQGFRPKRALIRLDHRVVLVLVVIAGVLGLGWQYLQVKLSLAEVDSRIAEVRKQEAGLKDLIALNNEVKDLRKKIAERVSIIKELTGDSDIRFLMLEHINSILPENLWLLSITETAENGRISFNIEGMSYSKDDISAFLSGLERYEKFSRVSLESIRPAPLEIRDAFNYVVKVELKSAKPPEPQEDKKNKTSRRRRPRRK